MRNIFILIFLFIALSANAQPNTSNEKGKISGKVTDALTKGPVDYATVGIYKQGSTTPFDGASTDPKGNFKIDNISPGEYTITVDFLGYKRQTIEHIII